MKFEIWLVELQLLRIDVGILSVPNIQYFLKASRTEIVESYLQTILFLLETF